MPLHTISGKLLRNPVTGSLCSTCCRKHEPVEPSGGFIVAVGGRTFEMGLHTTKYFPLDEFPADLFTAVSGFVIGSGSVIGVTLGMFSGRYEVHVGMSVTGTVGSATKNYAGDANFFLDTKTGSYEYYEGTEACLPLLARQFPKIGSMGVPLLAGSSALVTEVPHE